MLGVAAALIAAAAIAWSLLFSLDAEPLARDVAASGEACQEPCVFRFGPTDAGAGLVLYPGAGVEPAAYAPLAAEVADAGFLVAVHRAPLGLAFLDVDSASVTVDAFGDVGAWGVGGHSLGGAMAARFVSRSDQADGLVLLAAYPEGDLDLSDDDLAVLSIYGTEDPLATPDEVLSAAPRLPPESVFVEISGGNHAQFGSYGDQPRDAEATISPATQRREIVAAIVEFLSGLAG